MIITLRGIKRAIGELDVAAALAPADARVAELGRDDDTAGNPRRAQIDQFELFELIILLK